MVNLVIRADSAVGIFDSGEPSVPPSMLLDFDSGVVDQSVQSYTSSQNGTNGLFDVDTPTSEGLSMVTTCPNGDSGFESGFGLQIRILDEDDQFVSLVSGDEIWWAMDVKFMPTYNFNDAIPYQKFFRIKVFSQGQDPAISGGIGHIDVYIERPSGGDIAFHFVFEGQSPETLNYFGSYSGGSSCVAGQWQRFELYCKFATTTGGGAKLRFWIDGDLVGESTTITTLQNSTDFAAALLAFTYINGNAQRDVSIWIDNLTVYHTKGTGPPGNLDSLGHPYIGLD